MTGGAPLSATAVDLPPGVAAELANPPEGEVGSVVADGISWPTLSWGNPHDPPVLLVHGVTSNARIWWRVGPALAASGRRVVAIDMPGHGQAARRSFSPVHADTAADVAAFVRAAGLDRPDLSIIGHSWGGMVTANLPASGLRPRVLVLIDPPVMTVAELEGLTHDSTERNYSTFEEASAAVRGSFPDWSDGDVSAKAQALVEFDQDYVRRVLVENGDWDGGMAALRHESASGVTVWFIRGEWATGGLIPERAVPAIESQLGVGHVITIAGGPHSPQRTHPEATLVALLRALGTP